MIRGIYSSASGMLAETTRTDTIANNLANVNTAGYKKDVTVTKDFNSMLIHRINDGGGAPVVGSLGLGTIVDEIAPNYLGGALRQTGNKLDAAIVGDGFFTIDTPGGERYTRNGTFSLNARSELVTQDGNRVMGTNGPILIPGIVERLEIDQAGRLMADGVEAGQFRLVQFDNLRQLRKEGSSLYQANGAQTQPFTGQVEQGYLEMSNANVVSEMVNLIAAYRAYEVNSKTVQAHDQLLDKAVNEVGRV